MKSIQKVLILLLSLAIITSVQAQTDAGKFMLGGSSQFGFGFGSSKYKYDGESESGPKSTAINFSPSIGYFAINNLSVGLRVELQYEKEKEGSDEMSSTMFVAAPFVRYYFGASKIKPFADVMAGFGSIKEKYESEGYSEDGTNSIFILSGSFGVAFFLNDVVALDLMLGYVSTTTKNKDMDDIKYVSSNVSFAVGFSIIL